MDYRGLYDDLRRMRQRAIVALKGCEITGNEEQAQRWDDFIWELETFIGAVVIRKWR